MSKTERQIQLQPVDDDSWPPRTGHESFWGVKRSAHRWRPATDVYETDADYRVVVEIPGMRGVDISVTYEGQTLYVRGERHEREAHKGYHQMEISYGDFESAVSLPEPVERGAIEATYVDGFLRVKLPKATPTQVDID